jgi:hypothetical protein
MMIKLFLRVRSIFGVAGLVALLALIATTSGAHHSIAGEYSSNGELQSISGTVTKIRWYAPHIEIYIEATGGIVDDGTQWIGNSHAPGLLARTYGVFKEDVSVGDKLEFLGWKSNFDVPRFSMRALKINDGPMRSTLRPADRRAIEEGTLGEIVPAPDLDLEESYAADVGAVITDTASQAATAANSARGAADFEISFPGWAVGAVLLLLLGIGWKIRSGRTRTS